MKRILWVFLYIMIAAGCLSGCQQGVTDVGNPNIVDKPPQVSPNTTNPGPTLGQLIGAYSLPSPVAADMKPPPDGSPSPTTDPTAAPVTPMCKTDSQKTPNITSTMDPTQIVLKDFLDYGAGTENILASYDAKLGAISFQISDASVAIKSCTGTAALNNGVISVTLNCQATADGDPDCQVTLSKE